MSMKRFNKFAKELNISENTINNLWDANICSPQALAVKNKEDIYKIVDDDVLCEIILPALQKHKLQIAVAEDPYQHAVDLLRNDENTNQESFINTGGRILDRNNLASQFVQNQDTALMFALCPVQLPAQTSNREMKKFFYAGIKDRRVKDEDMSASSCWSSGLQAHSGRLDNTDSWHGFWHPASEDIRPGCWLQVDFKTPTPIAGVVTQGRPLGDACEDWVQSFKIAYGNSISSLQAIKDNSGDDMIFQGNRDRTSHVTNIFPEPITARYFRLIVQTFTRCPALRIEYLVC